MRGRWRRPGCERGSDGGRYTREAATAEEMQQRTGCDLEIEIKFWLRGSNGAAQQHQVLPVGQWRNLIFERDLDALSEHLERPHPEFFGTQVNDQPGGELQHDSIGGPMALSPHPELKYHVEHLDFMLHETQKELDNSRVYANQTHLHLAQHADAIKMLAKDRKSLRQQRAKKDATIARLRAKIVSLEATVKAQEDQLRELEKEGEYIQGGAAYLSDDDEFEEDENTDVEDYQFMEAGEDDFIPIDVDDQ
ncbi:hypothetical protein QYE76_030902 [Lolium multiflorum]|uniref:Uncharacterized protein n=1 Tax=Lolium multiflorum TaxID=4521 RepID=A0AAD8QTZ0_LOLMU|nr:hypothetical protein QYE76_030902 [Lolium multiflorum]